MEKLFKKSHRVHSLTKRTLACATAVSAAFAHSSALAKASASPAPAKAHLENYQDLVLKAQNLTLQQDRLQASQVLIRGLQRETRGSLAYKELARALDELTEVFYSEKAQNLFSTAESQALEKPREAVEQFVEALKAEDRNVSVLKALARVHLKLEECALADSRVRLAEEVNPFSAEVKLLRLQTLACQKNFDALTIKLAVKDPDLEPVEKFIKPLQAADFLRKKDLKKARLFLATWEGQAPDYPEVHYWKWQLSRAGESFDRAAATKYSQLCQSLTPRKRKSFSLDVDLCKGKVEVDSFLRESEAQSSPSPTEEQKK